MREAVADITNAEPLAARLADLLRSVDVLKDGDVRRANEGDSAHVLRIDGHFDFVGLAKALLTIPPWASMQPMETAPKDGPLLLRTEKGLTSAIWDKGEYSDGAWCRWSEDGVAYAGRADADFEDPRVSGDPIGWWPLPDASGAPFFSPSFEAAIQK